MIPHLLSPRTKTYFLTPSSFYSNNSIPLLHEKKSKLGEKLILCQSKFR